MANIPSIRLQHSFLEDGKLLFEEENGFDRATSDGFFALKVPSDMNLEPGFKFAREFYEADTGEPESEKYRGYRNRSDIYYDRENYQVEHVLTDEYARAKSFPEELISMVDSIALLALCIFKDSLSHIGIAAKDQGRATSDAAFGNGVHWFVAHHYRTNFAAEGCAAHQDTGFVTVLCCDQPGLEVHTEIGWQQIRPEPGYFIVNFGRSFEILTQRMERPVKASFHRVRRYLDSDPGGDRVSFATFVDPPMDAWLQQMQSDGRVTQVISVEHFLAENNRITWDGDHPEFGMSSSTKPAN